MRKTLFTLLLLPAMVMAKDIHVTDTLWADDELTAAKQVNATHYGIVKRVDSVENTATVHFFTREKPHLVATCHMVASGEGAGLRKGKQLYFNEDSKVQSMKIYTLVHDERDGKVSNRLAAETLLYPDGKTQEELTITYTMEAGKKKRTYDRKCFYPDGALQYEEHFDGQKINTVYYKPNGKVIKKPKKKIDPYETMPSFPGGQEAFFEFLSKNVKYPAIAQKNGIEGRVIVEFVVAKDGKIEKVKVARTGGDPSLDKEAVRVIKSMPRWTPGKRRGEPVRVKYTVPVNFRLN